MTTHIEQGARAEAERRWHGHFVGRADAIEDFVRGALWQSTRPEPPVTEEEVEAAARAGHEYRRALRPFDHGPYATWEQLDEEYREYLRRDQRAALEAARATREGKNRG